MREIKNILLALYKMFPVHRKVIRPKGFKWIDKDEKIEGIECTRVIENGKIVNIKELNFIYKCLGIKDK